MHRRLAIPLLYAAFVVSGAAGLIYESIWSRYLALFVGHGAYAQVIVLAIFLGGMSAGAFLAGRESQRRRHPLLGYAAVELAAGLAGLLFHPVFDTATGFAHATLFPLLAGSSLLPLAKWGLAALLILPQSVLLGTTFPLMSAGVVRHRTDQPGQTLATLYFANSIGAAGGVLLAGFVLVAWGGLPGTLQAAAGLNFVAAGAALVAARLLPRLEPAPAPRTAAAARLPSLLLAIAFGTALASFFYEIAWIRMLSLVLGSATHSFELMLSAFILGLALGSLAVRRFADREAVPLGTLVWVQWTMGAAALATLPVYAASFGWMAEMLRAFSRTDQGYAAFSFARYGLCLAIMLPPTFCAGMTLPLITRALLGAGWGERAIGLVYGVNTLGSIAGVVLASLVLMPLIGLRWLLIAGAAIDMGLAVVLAHDRGPGARGRGPGVGRWLAIAGAVLILAAAFGVRLDRAVLASGVFRGGVLPQPGELDVLFYEDGRTATIAVARSAWRGDLTLSTNGKPDASLGPEWFTTPKPGEPVPFLADNATQALLSLVALAHRSEARTAILVGLGSGSSSHFLLGSPALESATTVEIEPAIVRAARLFLPANRRAYDDPRHVIAVDDARSFLAAAPGSFDLILSEPSNPWVSGVADLFTWELYRAVAAKLAPGGIFAQWLHLYEIDDDLVLSVLAAMHPHFAAYDVFQVGPGDIVIIASRDDELPPPDWSVFSLPNVAADLDRFVAFTPEMLDSMRVLDRAALAPLLDAGVQANSDFYPLLDLGAERARFLGSGAGGLRSLARQRFDLTAPIVGRRPLASEPRSAITGDERLEARARSARLRAARDSGDLSPLLDDPGDADAAHRLSVWQRLLAPSEPPADWRRWVADTLVVEADLHGGAAGDADNVFYLQAGDYLQTKGAPRPAIDALAFVEGLARWDFSAASAAADRLLPLTLNGQPWLPPDLLLEGAVVAKVQLGQQESAREFYQALASSAYEQPNDLRRRLLAAYVGTE